MAREADVQKALNQLADARRAMRSTRGQDAPEPYETLSAAHARVGESALNAGNAFREAGNPSRAADYFDAAADAFSSQASYLETPAFWRGGASGAALERVAKAATRRAEGARALASETRGRAR